MGAASSGLRGPGWRWLILFFPLPVARTSYLAVVAYHKQAGKRVHRPLGVSVSVSLVTSTGQVVVDALAPSLVTRSGDAQRSPPPLWRGLLRVVLGLFAGCLNDVFFAIVVSQETWRKDECPTADESTSSPGPWWEFPA